RADHDVIERAEGVPTDGARGAEEARLGRREEGVARIEADDGEVRGRGKRRLQAGVEGPADGGRGDVGGEAHGELAVAAGRAGGVDEAVVRVAGGGGELDAVAAAEGVAAAGAVALEPGRTEVGDGGAPGLREGARGVPAGEDASREGFGGGG